ncbi:hypothetical protein R3P38DRAFT_3003639 [Favolaschia claudopus]|uniref:Secreted protein n=1 Tax=Favolaschia claudopus TaxID=2862362 RepID=A0AAW0AKD8_9AGAR
MERLAFVGSLGVVGAGTVMALRGGRVDRCLRSSRYSLATCLTVKTLDLAVSYRMAVVSVTDPRRLIAEAWGVWLMLQRFRLP